MENADKTGTGTHDDGDFSTDGTDGKELYQSDDTGNEHGILEQSDLKGCQFCISGCGRDTAGTTDDQDRGQVADKHGKDVLQTKRNGLTERDLPIEFIGRTAF